jgi:choline kinase
MTKAIILAAGRGSRMKHLTNDKPKCLNELHGKPLLQYQLDALRGAGISEIGIVSGYQREKLQSFGLYEFFNERWAQTNMVSSLECAASWLGSDTVIVSYSDIFYDVSAITALLNCQAQLAVAYDPQWLSQWQGRFADPLSDAETFRIDANQRLLEIGNKPHAISEVQGQYMGLLKFTPQAWKQVCLLRASLTAEQQDRMHMTGTLQLLLSDFTVTAVPYSGQWGEIDSETDMQFFQSVR